ncbi:MAG: N-acetylmuramoyl-L-alanine amidase [Deltaproteobacteria bacterium]|nr:N-acetylmuramoyl-L-alanine amidase [Deltaproteobacteria bacterium]
MSEATGGAISRIRWLALAVCALPCAVALRQPVAPPPVLVPSAPPQVEVAEVAFVAPQSAGALTGLVVYLSAGHGWIWHRFGEGWQRPEVEGLIEDVWTAGFVSEQLAPALERAGAVVLTARERDPHRVSVQAGAREAVITGEPQWSVVAPEGRGPVPLASSLERREAAVVPGGSARWGLSLPASGSVEAYLWWGAGSECGAAVEVELSGPDGVQRQRLDQRVHGEAWWPLGAVRGLEGDAVEVSLRAAPGEALCLGGVRLGGGEIEAWDARARQVRVARAYDLAALHVLPAMGAPWWSGAGGKGLDGDATRRARWAAWAHPEGEEAVYLSIHSDAGGGRGTAVVIRERPRGPADQGVARGSLEVARAVRRGLVGAVRGRRAAWWRDRGVVVDDLAELDPVHNGEMPAVLIEVGFHDRADEAALLRERTFQELAADGVVAGLARWRGGALPPGPPVLRVEEGALWWEAALPGTPWGPVDTWQLRWQQGGRWTPPLAVGQPPVQLPRGVEAVEVQGLGQGGLGRPAQLQLSGGH